MPFAHTQIQRKIGHALLGEGAFFNAPSGGAGQSAHGVDLRIAGRQLWPTAQAGAKTGLLGRGRAGVKGTVFAARRFGRTDRAAIDAGAGHAYIKLAIKAAVFAHQRLIADVGAEFIGWL